MAAVFFAVHYQPGMHSVTALETLFACLQLTWGAWPVQGLVQMLRDAPAGSTACTDAALALERIAAFPGTAQGMPHIECADAAMEALQHGPMGCHASCLQLLQHLLRPHSSLGTSLLDQGDFGEVVGSKSSI